MLRSDTDFPEGQFCEALEARIAPASMVDGSGSVTNLFDSFDTPAHQSIVTFQDIDGDNVTVAFSKKILTSNALIWNIFQFSSDSDDGRSLLTLNLTATGLDAAKMRGLNISITAEPANGGDGQVDVGFLNAAGIDLGKVTVDGALAKIVAGDAKAGTAGLKALTVESLGLADGSEPANLNAISSVVTGALTKLHVSGDVAKAFLSVEGGSKAGINQLFVGGSLLGGSAQDSGSIQVSGKIGKAQIDGDLAGGAGKFSGALMAGSFTSVTVGGDVVGGSGTAGWSGVIYTEGRLAKILIEGHLEGGAGTRSGLISAETAIGTLEIQQDLIGGHGYAAGRVETAGGITKAVILGNIQAGTGDYAGSLMALKAIKSVHVGEDLIGGTTKGSGSIFSEQSINKVTIVGDLIGNTGEGSGCVEAEKRVLQVEIGGNLIGGTGDKSGSVLSFGGKISRVDHDGTSIAGTGDDSGGFYGAPSHGSLQISGSSNYSSGSTTATTGVMAVFFLGNDAPIWLAWNAGLYFTAVGDLPTEGLIESTSLVVSDGATLRISNAYLLPANTRIEAGGSLIVTDSASVKLPNGTFLPPGTYTNETLAPYFVASPGLVVEPTGHFGYNNGTPVPVTEVPGL